MKRSLPKYVYRQTRKEDAPPIRRKIEAAKEEVEKVKRDE